MSKFKSAFAPIDTVVQMNKSRPTPGYKLPRQFNNSDKPGHCSHVFTELLPYMIFLHFWTWNRLIVDDIIGLRLK